MRPLSPSQFVEEIGGSMSHIARCFRELADWGLIEIFEERRGGRHGGGVERIYRSLRRPYFDTDSWESLPQLIREEMSQSFLHSYSDRVSEAVEAGTFDIEAGRHFSWKPIVVDRRGWDQVSNSLDELLYELPILEAESVERISDPQSLIPSVIGLFSFLMPSQTSRSNL